MTHTVFVIEDDPVYAKVLTYSLSLNPEFIVKSFSSGKECLENLQMNPLFVTVDFRLPDMTGGELLKKIKLQNPHTQVLIISGQEDISTAVALLKDGASDYITKDEHTKERLMASVNNLLKNQALVEKIDNLQKEVAEKYLLKWALIGNSKPMKQIFAMIEKATRTNITVSIHGETGTGKELVAKAIHFNSDRKKMPFVPVNVAAIPNELIESELFGYEKGSFTGAHARRIGRFEEANKGTIFLDEIAEMDFSLQAKLLRVLQERQISRIGGNQLHNIDVRIIVATHKDLASEVKKGTFREDLYYRLLGLPIALPALRERGSDILLLAKNFLSEFVQENNMEEKSFSPQAQQKLLKYSYPGNVRELRAVVELGAVLSNGMIIQADDIIFKSINRTSDFLLEEMTLKAYEFKIIKHYLDKYDHNILKVSEKLDIGKSTIYRYLKDIKKMD